MDEIHFTMLEVGISQHLMLSFRMSIGVCLTKKHALFFSLHWPGDVNDTFVCLFEVPDELLSRAFLLSKNDLI